MWGSGLQIIRDYPWTGVGMNGVKGVYQAYKHPDAVRDQRGHLHSNLFQIAAERGLIGVVCWLWIWVAFYHQAWRIFPLWNLGPSGPRRWSSAAWRASQGFMSRACLSLPSGTQRSLCWSIF